MTDRPARAVLSSRAVRLASFVGLTILVCPSLFAEPYIAVRTGFKCSQCHVNKTGGGKRNDFGIVYAQSQLPMMFWSPFREGGFVDGEPFDRVSIGTNFRADRVSSFDYSTPSGLTATGTSDTAISQANVYLQVDLVPDVVTFYMDRALAPNGVNRELFGMVQGLPLSSYVKVGRMVLPYGLRLLDDDAFIRNNTRYTFERHAVGVEAGIEPGAFSFVTNVTEDQLSMTGALVVRRFRVGASYGEDLNGFGSSVWGGFAGVNVGRFTFLGEGDVIREGGFERLAGLAEVNFLLTRGLNVKATYEFFDRDRSLASDLNQERITLGLEPFLTQFLQVGVFYRINRSDPVSPTSNQDELRVQLHAFF